MSTALDWTGKDAAFALGRRLISRGSTPSDPTATAPPTTAPMMAGDDGTVGHLGEGPGFVRNGTSHSPGLDENLLVVGDNLPALTTLLATHRGRVKVVYIDPPYNTGNALAYKDHGHDHASWLSFMTPRLMLARELMRDDGVLFIHLDDSESAWAQLIGHEIFGEENSLGTLIHQRARGGGNSPSFVRGHDYVHVWGRDASTVGPFLTEKKAPAKLEIIDGKSMLVETDVLRASFGRYARGRERRLMYEDILSVKGAKKLAEVDAKLATGEFVLRPWGTAGKHAVVRVTPAEKASSKLYSIIKALGGPNDLDELGLGGMFSYPKPVELVKTLVASQTFFDPEAIVLDFFAGSGTTAQAVMAANQRDAGARKFILVQTPEPLQTKNSRSLGSEADGAAGGVGDGASEVGLGGAGVAGDDAGGVGLGGADGAGLSTGDAGGKVRDGGGSTGSDFTEISRLTSERIRRAAKKLDPELTFTEVTIAD